MKTEIFEVKTGNSEQSLGELRKSLKEAKSELLSLTEGTEEYAAALEKASNAEQTLRDMSETVTRQSKGLEGAMQGLSAGLAGISGATNSVLGVMSMLGVENEELNKKLNQSITALIGVTQGLQAIDPAIKGFKDMNKVIKTVTGSLGKVKIAWMATGLGALVILIGSLIANWDEFSASIGISTDLFDKFGTIVKKTIRAATTVIKNFTQGITQTVAGVVNALKKVVKGDFSGAFDEIKKGFKNAGREFKEIFTETVSEWGTDLPPKAKEEAKKTGTKIGKEMGESAAEEAARAFIEKIENWNKPIEIEARVEVKGPEKPEDSDISSLVNATAIKAAEYDKKKADEDEQNRLEKKKKTYSEINSLISAQGELFGVLSEVFADNEEASKAMAIASIISDTAAAIMGTWAGYADLGAWGAVAAAIQTAAITATGALQIANVKNQTISQGYTPNIPDVKTSAIQQSNYQGGDYQVYVTETDITDTQNRVRVIENQAKY